MSQKVSIEEMDKAIMQEMEKYANMASDELKGAIKGTAKDVKKDIQDNAPKNTGAYKKSWTIKNIHEDSNSVDLVVHSRNRYQIAHLLEYGHAKRGGGRVEAKPHIKAAEERGKDELVKQIKERLGGYDEVR